MIVKAKKSVCKSLVILTKEFHSKLIAGDYDEVYEELITEESVNFMAATAWPFMAYKNNNLDFLVDSTLNPNPEIPIHDSLSLAFQMDTENCRTGLFHGFTDALIRFQMHQFSQKDAIAFLDRRSAILAADTPNLPLFVIFVKQKNEGYLIDFLALWLFSMEMKASILWEIASHAEMYGNSEYAIEYLKLASSLEETYSRIDRLMCKNIIVGQYITSTRKQEIDQQMEMAIKASERLQMLTSSIKDPLPLAQYERILEIATKMATVMERSPESFGGLGEEDIRQHFLVHLNGHFNGNATGETFNFHGKTDILIRSENTNIFIAECKFWRGSKAFYKTIDQILDYATWRDSRLAIFIFNRNRNLSDVLEKINNTLKKHSAYLHDEVYDCETGFRCYLRHKDDSQRELLMTILVFDIPQ